MPGLSEFCNGPSIINWRLLTFGIVSIIPCLPGLCLSLFMASLFNCNLFYTEKVIDKKHNYECTVTYHIPLHKLSIKSCVCKLIDQLHPKRSAASTPFCCSQSRRPAPKGLRNARTALKASPTWRDVQGQLSICYPPWLEECRDM